MRPAELASRSLLYRTRRALKRSTPLARSRPGKSARTVSPHPILTSDGSPYLLSIPMQIKAVMKRRVRIMRGQLLFHAINTFVFLIMGVIMGTCK